MLLNDTTNLFHKETITILLQYLDNKYICLNDKVNDKTYTVSDFEHDYSEYCYRDYGKFVDIYNLEQLENLNMVVLLSNFIRELVTNQKLLSKPITMSKHFWHDNLQKWLDFNACKYVEHSCSKGSNDIVYTQFVAIQVVLTRRITIEKLMDYIKLPDKYDRVIALQRNAKYNIREQQSYLAN